MISICGLTPNQTYWQLLRLATQSELHVEPSRNGDYFDLGHVAVELDHGERLCLLKTRGFNPIFALVESAWLLAGRNDLAPLQAVIKKYGQYSDDGRTLNGAYGFRLRTWFGVDQVEKAIQELRRLPSSRRVVLLLYAVDDLGDESADIPCNTQVILRIERGRLAMTVINRSNDLWLGVPYNWFAFRALQQFISGRLKVPVGPQRHLSTCMHLYHSDLQTAARVVASNSMDSIGELEENCVPFDNSAFLSDVPALSTANFAAIQSPEIAAAVDRYLNYREVKWKPATYSPHALDIALDSWIAMRHLQEEVNVPTRITEPNLESSIHREIQRWICSSENSREDVLAGVRAAGVKVSPFLQGLLSQGLPKGVQVQLDDPVSDDVKLHVVLELILGCLDPWLIGSPIGDTLRKQLQLIASELELPPQQLRAREMSDPNLKAIFQHILD